MAFSLKDIFTGTGGVQLGIDVGASAIKVVSIEKGSDGTQLLGLGWEETPTGAVVDGSLNDIQTICKAVKSALDQTRTRYSGASATVGLRGLNVIYKRLMIPYQGMAELPKQVLLEAQQHVDSDLDHWQIDYEPLEAANTEGQIPILLVAAKRTLVEQYVEMLKQVGVKPCVLDCDAFAMTNSFEFTHPEAQQTTLCVDVGRDSTKVHMLRAGKSVIIRSLPLGGGHFTDLLSKNLNINYTEAESIKWNVGNPDFTAGYPDIDSVCRQHTNELCEEIKKTIEFYGGADSHGGDRLVDVVVLSGGGSVVPGLSESLSTLLGADAIYASPFKGMTINKKVNN
ncbi:MAG: type pilus assembly protein PilM, partial [Pseudomonadota bacterium]